jgi:low affinity Fe/Cu permease
MFSAKERSYEAMKQRSNHTPEAQPAKASRHSQRKRRKDAGNFHKFAQHCARIAGRPVTFGIAVLIILVWGLSGALFHFSDTWQLVINTGTTIVTFLMVFLIQNTQNRDSEALQLKLDELIRATKTAHTALLDVEELSEEELDQLRHAYQKMAQESLQKIRAGKTDLTIPYMEKNIRH